MEAIALVVISAAVVGIATLIAYLLFSKPGDQQEVVSKPENGNVNESKDKKDRKPSQSGLSYCQSLQVALTNIDTIFHFGDYDSMVNLILISDILFFRHLQFFNG